MKTYLTAYR